MQARAESRLGNRPVTNGGEVKAMARVIEFYVPGKFRWSAKWVPPKQHGKVIQFPTLQKKSA
jgi:hypothetical protein